MYLANGANGDIVSTENRLPVDTVYSGSQGDAFGRLRVAEPFTLGDYKHLFAIDPNFIDFTANGGTVTFTGNTASATLSTNNSTSSVSVHQTKFYHSYQPGKSQVILSSVVFGYAQQNVTKRTGYFDDRDGIYFEQVGSNTSNGTDNGTLNFVIRSFVTGNLTVTGNVTYVATNQLNLGDAVITLNADLGQSALPTEDAGIEIERGRYQNASILWNETLDRWQFTDNVSTSNIGSAAAEVYANAAYDAANAAYAFAGQATIAVSGAALAANAAGSYANAAFLRANAAFSGTTGTHSNSAYAHANAAFAAANSATPQAVQSAFDKANSAFDAANNAFIAGGQIAGSYANSAYLQANAAFNRANSANNLINETRLHANGAFSEANNATLIGLAAFALANSIQFSQGTEIATYAWVNSNAAYNHANGAFVQANTANVQSVVSGIYANAAFALANTKFNTSGGTISGDVVVSGNLRVDGDRAQFLVSSISIEDNLIDIATDQTGAPSLNSGIRVIRGDESPVLLRWNESNDYWQFTNDGISYSNIGSYAAESYANSAFGVANTANAHSISAFSLANTVNAIAQAAYDTANNAGSSAILQAAFNTANSAGSYANGAFGAANSAGSFANSALGAATTADQRAVTAGVFANAAFEIANVSNEKAASGYRHANASFNWANSAYNAANSKLDLSGGTLTGPLTVQGGVTIVGGLLYANSSTVILADNIITLNAAIDQASAPAFNAGIEVDRGTSDNVAFIWNESDDHWQFTNDGTIERVGNTPCKDIIDKNNIELSNDSLLKQKPTRVGTHKEQNYLVYEFDNKEL